LCAYDRALKDNLIVYQGAVGMINPKYPGLIKNYILKGDFSFFEGAKYLTHNECEVMINQGGGDKSLCLVDNVHGSNWSVERDSYLQRLTHLNLTERLSLDGDMLCLISTQWSQSNIFHLLFDSLGKLAVVDAYDDIFKFTYLIPRWVPSYSDLFDELGLKYLEYDKNAIYDGTFYVPSMPSYLGDVSRDVCQLFQKLASNLHYEGDEVYQYIYIGRRPPTKRGIANQDEVLECLRKFYDFKVIYLEDYPLHKQIQFFRNASIIVGPHGAGLSWSVFSVKPALFEIHSPYYANRCFETLINNSLGTYWSVKGESKPNGVAQDDYYLSIPDLERSFLIFIDRLNSF
jgi:hypothetical protein